MKMKKNAKHKERDLQLEEFETKDLGPDIIASGVKLEWIRPRLLPTSILLSPEIVSKLRMKAAKRGIGYQTMLKIIVHEHLDEY